MVYVDNDPVVLSHARALLASDPAGATDYIDADLRDTARVLSEAERTLDFSEPVAVMLLGILHMVGEQDDPRASVAALMTAVPSGSFLTISHPASDIDAAAGAEASGATTHRQPSQPRSDLAPMSWGSSKASSSCGPAWCRCPNGDRAPRSKPRRLRTCGAVSPASPDGRGYVAWASRSRQRSARATSSLPSISSRCSAGGAAICSM